MATTKITTNSLADASVTSAKLANSISIGTLGVTGNLTVVSGGQILSPNGTALIPAQSFSGDSDTGLFLNTANQLGISTGGVTRVFISSASLTTTMPIEFTVGAVGSLGLRMSADSNTGFFGTGSDVIATATGGVERMRVDASGNVGIGTTSPSARLHTISTTEQLRLGYDASNYVSTTVSSAGLVTLDAVGAGAGFVFSDSLTINGNLTLGTAGNKINITEGSNASVGVATLVAGTVVVNTTAVTANSRIFLTRQTTSGTIGTSVDVTARVAGTSFTITANGSMLDTSTVAWLIIN